MLPNFMDKANDRHGTTEYKKDEPPIPGKGY